MKKVWIPVIIIAVFICMIATLHAYTDEEIWEQLKQAEQNELFSDAPSLIIFDDVSSRFKTNGANVFRPGSKS